MARIATKGVSLLAQCVPCVKQNTSKFRVRKMKLDTNLLMYFKTNKYIFAYDPEIKCKTGDIVLIKELPQRLTRLITHSVEEIVYPLGDITDPITGKKVVVGKYRDDIEEASKLFGKSQKAFDYNKAPPRGRLEGTKDFTHVEAYIKYHDDGSDQPFVV